MGSSREQSEELRVFIVSYRVLCLPVLLGLVIAGWDPQHAALRNHQEKKQQRILLLSLKYPQALRSKTTTHSKKERKKERQTRSLRESGLVSRGSVFCQNDKQPHTHTSPGSPLSLSLRRDGGRRRWAGTAPWSTDRTVTPSALTRSLPHRWHATTYHSRALRKMLEKT